MTSAPRVDSGPLWLRALPFVWAALLAMAMASLLAKLYGQNPLAMYRLLLAGTWGSVYGIGQVLFKTTPLVCTGLAVAVALRAGLFNVGAEGQLIVGALAAALCGAYLPIATPGFVALPLCLLCAFVAGGVLGSFVGLCKWLCRAHEVIVTILLNFIIRAAMIGVGGYLFLKESVHTAPVIASSRLPRLSTVFPQLHGSAVNAALLLAVALAILVELLLRRTRIGFALRVVGQNPDAAAAAGLSLGWIRTLALTLSGGLAGLGGANFVLGYKYYYEDGFSSGIGYLGIAVAVLGHKRPMWVLLSALFFGTLAQGGLAVNAMVPRELIDVLSAVVILAVATGSAEVSRLLPRFRNARPPLEPPPRQSEPPSEPEPSEPARDKLTPQLVAPPPADPSNAWVSR